jgi:uncharacterized phage protein (TIGR01671 family)
MRKIKFRAYDDIKNEIIYNVFFDGQWWCYLGNCGGTLPEKDVNIKIGCKNGTPPIMQLTPFKDENSKEIYESDILYGREEGDGETTAWTDVYYLVFFNEKWGRWQVRQKNTSEESCWCDDLSDIVNEYQVVGNIHENPELFK